MNRPSGYRKAKCCSTCRFYEPMPYESCGQCTVVGIVDDQGYPYVYADYICDLYKRIPEKDKDQ